MNAMAEFESFKPDEIGCMPKLWKQMNSGDNNTQPYCVIDSQQEASPTIPCKIATTRSEIFVQ